MTGRSWHGETACRKTGQDEGEQRTLRQQKPSPVFMSIRSMIPYLSNSLSISLGVAPYSKFPQKTYSSKASSCGTTCRAMQGSEGKLQTHRPITAISHSSGHSCRFFPHAQTEREAIPCECLQKYQLCPAADSGYRTLSCPSLLKPSWSPVTLRPFKA